jgi:hypothetical protein
MGVMSDDVVMTRIIVRPFTKKAYQICLEFERTFIGAWHVASKKVDAETVLKEL